MRFGRSGEATEWEGKKENGVAKDFSVDFLLDLDLVLTRSLLGAPFRGPSLGSRQVKATDDLDDHDRKRCSLNWDGRSQVLET